MSCILLRLSAFYPYYLCSAYIICTLPISFLLHLYHLYSAYTIYALFVLFLLYPYYLRFSHTICTLPILFALCLYYLRFFHTSTLCIYYLHSAYIIFLIKSTALSNNSHHIFLMKNINKEINSIDPQYRR